MYSSHPAVQAAKTVLQSQLLSGGIRLVRAGAVVETTAEFQSHLEKFWTPFATDVIDSFLKWGLCAAVFDVAPNEEHADAMNELKRELGIKTGKRKAGGMDAPRVLVPHVPHLGTYDVAWRNSDTYGYTRNYVVYNNSPGHATRVDPAALVFVRQHPDATGNLNSPLATVFEQGSFVHGLVEMAFTAEISRSAPSIVTQVRKAEKQTDLSAGALFFDSESRQVHDSNDKDESQRQARDLDAQAQLCRVINDLQTRSASGGSSSSKPAFAQPEVQPRLFVLPKDQELAPHVQTPQPRGDLEALVRLGIDQFSAALGVPSSLLFEGKFSNNSSTQLQLLNSTVSQLAKSVNSVLSRVYCAIYDDDECDERATLQLHTAPLTAAAEVTSLFTAQLIDIETALPAALHSLGATVDEIDEALKRAQEKAKKQCECEDKERELAIQEREIEITIKKAAAAAGAAGAAGATPQPKMAGVAGAAPQPKMAGATPQPKSAAGAAGAAGAVPQPKTNAK